MRFVFVGLIRIYRYSLSLFLGRSCRHLPTCSEYAERAFALHGSWRGSWLTLARIARCHPWGSQGYDPVPDVLTDAGLKFWQYGRWSGKHIETRYGEE